MHAAILSMCLIFSSLDEDSKIRNVKVWGYPGCSACKQAKNYFTTYSDNVEKHPKYVEPIALKIGYPVIEWKTDLGWYYHDKSWSGLKPLLKAMLSTVPKDSD